MFVKSLLVVSVYLSAFVGASSLDMRAVPKPIVPPAMHHKDPSNWNGCGVDRFTHLKICLKVAT